MLRIRMPKDDTRHSWTAHAKMKMREYGISESLVRRVMRNPAREEDGIAPNTRAVMVPMGHAKHRHEVWVMYRVKGIERRIISAWRYPGTSPIDKPITIPASALEALTDDEV